MGLRLTRSTRNRRRRCAALALVVIATACVDTGPVDRTTITDSAGTSIVSNRFAGPALPDWTVSAEPLADIGGDETDDTQLLFGVAGANRLSDGRIVIAEEGGNRLRVYSPDGVWLADWGRAGEGPGEFRDLGRVHVVPGDSIVVWDAGLRRFSMFTATGDFVRSWTLTTPAGGSSVSPVALAARSQWLARPGFGFSSDMPTGLYGDSIPYLRFTIDGTFIDTIGRFPSHQNFLFNDGGNTVAGSLPFLLSTHIAPTADGFWICSGARFEIERHGADGGLLVRTSVMDADLELEQSRFQAWVDNALTDVPADQRQFFERFVRAVPRPDRVPACTALVVDAMDHVWVRGYVWPGDGVVAWHVFGPDGRLIAAASLPERLTVYAIGGDWLLGTWLDETDVERVRLLRLERAAA